jgi:ribonuclease E
VVALAIAVAGYRIAREAPPAQAAPQLEPPGVVSKPPVNKSPLAVPALPATTPVPAPPPIRKAAGNIVRTAGREIPPAESPVAIPVVETPVIEAPQPIVEPLAQVPAVIPPEPTAPVVAAAKEPEPVQDTRGKRWLKAVGRWVHVVKN